jgi:hypothetical protein
MAYPLHPRPNLPRVFLCPVGIQKTPVDECLDLAANGLQTQVPIEGTKPQRIEI